MESPIIDWNDISDDEIETQFFKRFAEYDIQNMLDFHEIETRQDPYDVSVFEDESLEKELIGRGYNIPDPEDFKMIETFLRLENYDEVLYLITKIIPPLDNYRLKLTK